jgi:cytoskeletal protein RodZ
MGKWFQFLRKKGTPASESTTEQPDNTETLSDLGQLLRQARQEQHISLEALEQETRIRQKYILAIEEGRYDELPTLGHIHGFMRNYALALGLDMQEVEELYAKERGAHHRFEPRIFHPKNIALLPKKPLLRANALLAIVIVLLLGTAGWFFWQYGWPWLQPQIMPQPTTTATATAVPTTTATPTQTATHENIAPTSTPEEPATATSTLEPTTTPEPTVTPTLDAPLVLPTPTAKPTNTPTPKPTPEQEGVTLLLKFVDRVWLQVAVDGQDLPGEMFETGDEKEWQAEFTIYLICGNAGGVEATVNGEELGLLGERAEVVEKIWGPEGEIEPTPEVEPTPTQAP